MVLHNAEPVVSYRTINHAKYTVCSPSNPFFSFRPPQVASGRFWGPKSNVVGCWNKFRGKSLFPSTYPSWYVKSWYFFTLGLVEGPLNGCVFYERFYSAYITCNTWRQRQVSLVHMWQAKKLWSYGAMKLRSYEATKEALNSDTVFNWSYEAVKYTVYM